MLKIAEIHDQHGMVAFPVEANANWSQEARKLAHIAPLFIKLVNIRDVRPEDDLEEMLDNQCSRFVEFSDDHRTTEDQFDAGIDLFYKTLGVIP